MAIKKAKHIPSMKAAKDYFELSMSEMKSEWVQGGLTEEEKGELARLCAEALNKE